MADIQDQIASLVGGVHGIRIAGEILALIRQRAKNASMPEPRYTPYNDEEIRDNYTAGFMTGRYQERQNILRALGEKVRGNEVESDIEL